MAKPTNNPKKTGGILGVACSDLLGHSFLGNLKSTMNKLGFISGNALNLSSDDKLCAFGSKNESIAVFRASTAKQNAISLGNLRSYRHKIANLVNARKPRAPRYLSADKTLANFFLLERRHSFYGI